MLPVCTAPPVPVLSSRGSLPGWAKPIAALLNSRRALAATVKKIANRRDANRFTHRSPMLYRAGTSTFVRGSTCDFSMDGARLRVRQPVPTGSAVALNVSVREPHSDSPRLLSLQATVVWSRGGEIGVAFSGGCPADVRSLQIWVRSQLLTRRLER